MGLKGKVLCQAFLDHAHKVIEDPERCASVDIDGILFDVSIESQGKAKNKHVLLFPSLNGAGSLVQEYQGSNHKVNFVSVSFNDNSDPTMRVWIKRGAKGKNSLGITQSTAETGLKIER